MVGQHQIVGTTLNQGGIACSPRSSLKTEAALPLDTDPGNFEQNRESTAKITAELCPGVGMRGEAVVDVHGGQAPSQTKATQEMQQDDGVAAARKADTK